MTISDAEIDEIRDKCASDNQWGIDFIRVIPRLLDKIEGLEKRLAAKNDSVDDFAKAANQFSIRYTEFAIRQRELVRSLNES